MAQRSRGRRSTSRGSPPDPGPVPRQVLCLGTDPDLRAELVAICQEAGVGAHTSTLAPPVEQWRDAAMVLLDARHADLARGLPRRQGVVLVHHDPNGDDAEAQVWRDAVAVGADQVVVLPLARTWLLDAVRKACRPRGRCVAIVGARGGAGATSAAVALATAAATAGHRVMLLDADPLGGGIDLALGAEGLPGMRWAELHDVRGPLPPGGLGAVLPVADGAVVLSHGRDVVAVQPEAVRVVLSAALDEHDLVVIDLPRAGGPAAEMAARYADTLVCVCPSEVRSGAGAPAVLRRWAGTARVHLLVRGPCPGGMRPRDAADVVRAGLSLLPDGGAFVAGGGSGETGQAQIDRVDVVGAEPGLAAALERGEPFGVGPRSPLRRWAQTWLREVMPGGERAVA